MLLLSLAIVDSVIITLAGDDRTISVVVYDNGVGSDYVIEQVQVQKMMVLVYSVFESGFNI